MRTGPDTDSGIGRGSSSTANMTAGGGGGSNPKLWTSFKRQVRKFGGSTGSLSSPSPTSEDQAATAAAAAAANVESATAARSSSSLYSPDVARLDSPREGGFSEESLPRSAAVLKAHIKELYAQISKAESDKQKIADQAYHRATLIRRECEARLEDARAGQEHQASLVERLRDKVVEYKAKLEAADKKAERLAREARHSEIRCQDTNEVLKTLEERLRITEVSTVYRSQDRHFFIIETYRMVD